MTIPRRHVYLDHAATTPLDPRVFEAMVPFLKESYGNASSVHALGRKARFAVEESRERIAAIYGVTPGEIIFTSGGTEANNAAIKGTLSLKEGGLLTSMIEHEAVLTQAESLHRSGRLVKLLPPGKKGETTLRQVQAAIDDRIALVSCMHANNEVGITNPVWEIGAYCGERGIAFHTDAVQTAGWYNWGRGIADVDLLSVSAHKFNGPKGIGCLIATRNAALSALVEGGAQERRRRGGTENVAAIAGMAKALELAVAERNEWMLRLIELRDLLIDGLKSALDDTTFNFNTPLDAALTAPHIVNITFPPEDGVPMDGEMLILNLDMAGVMVSSGSACTSGAIEPSHVLQGMGLSEAEASAAVRFSMGKGNTDEDIYYAMDRLREIVKRMRGNARG